MLIGVIADDFTGASDIGSALSKGASYGRGLRCALYLGVPEREADGEVEAGIIALKSRSLPASDAVQQSLAACKWLLAQGCEQIVFKYCSTFDSTEQGNIGPVIDALTTLLSVQTAIVCPAFPAMGRTLYQGHLFVADTLLNESGMAHHPLTPMRDADVRRLLRAQSCLEVGHVPHEIVREGVAGLRTAFSQRVQKRQPLVVIDALSNDDLNTIGQACHDHRLVTGSAGIGFALPDNFIRSGKAPGAAPATIRFAGPAVVLVGSCSLATRQQTAEYACSHPVLTLDVAAIMQQKFTASEALDFIRQYREHSPMICSNSEPDYVAAMQRCYGVEPVAAAIESLLSEVACRTVALGIRKVIVGGGETSGAIVSALAPGELTIGSEVATGVPVLLSRTSPPLALVLKSGNFGDINFFQDACDLLEG